MLRFMCVPSFMMEKLEKRPHSRIEKTSCAWCALADGNELNDSSVFPFGSESSNTIFLKQFYDVTSHAQRYTNEYIHIYSVA